MAFFSTRSQAAQSRGSALNALFFRGLLRPNAKQQVGHTGCKKSQEGVPEKAVSGTRSLAAQPRDSAPRILRLLAFFWEANSLQK